MNDFDFEISQKKRIARGARNRVRGSKSRFVSLPSDNMTRGQWKKMNGEVKQYNIKKPIGYKDFKKMPEDLQIEYLEFMRNTFGAGCKLICESFGISDETYRNTLKRLGIDTKLYDTRRNRLGVKEDEFHEWLYQTADANYPRLPVQEDVAQKVTISTEVARPVTMPVKRMEIEFAGVINPEQIANTIRSISAKDKKYSVRICVEECNDG